MSKLLIVIVVLVLAGSGAYWFLIKGKQVTPKSSNSISIDEVSKHKASDDCWIVIEGNAYNVTEFIPNHPGKDEILKGCGKDATVMFNVRPTDGTSHSAKARKSLEKYLIGPVN